MAEADIDEPASAHPELALNPFEFMQGVASRIAGLGGNAPGHDPAYVFHTAYVEAAQGPAHFTVEFANLRARRGTLVLRVHMLRDEEGAIATLANSDRITLNRLVMQGGRVEIRFEGFRQMRYALVARIADDTDAQADGLAITLDRPAVAIDPDDIVIDARPTAYGEAGVRPAVRLLAYDRPTLAQPASQPATVPQTREPAFETWRRRIGTATSPLEDWQNAYVLQALESYGMLRQGAHGVGFGTADSALPDVIAGFGIEVLAVTPGAEDAALPAPTAGITRRAMDLAAVARDVVNQDFAWSSAVVDRFETVAAGLRFLEEAMNCLRPGGIAVHSFAYDIEGGASGVQGRRAPPLTRADVERLALNLISRGHEVAQIKIDGSKPLTAARGSPRSAFGLVARKGASLF